MTAVLVPAEFCHRLRECFHKVARPLDGRTRAAEDEGSQPMHPSGEHAASAASHAAAAPEPPSATLIGRLFVVPAIIVTVMICLAIVVVLFGGTTVGQRPSIDDLLRTIESDAGKHTAGMMLFPADREVWQAAQELATRLTRKNQELTPEQIDQTAERIDRVLGTLKKPAGADDEVVRAFQTKQQFLIMALARLNTPRAVDTVAKYLDNTDPQARQAALSGLMEMRDQPAVHERVPAVVQRLDDESPAVQIVATAAVGVLAKPDDTAAIKALRQKLAGDREVQWNAAVALAKLGSKSGKAVLLNMLDRGFWEKSRVQYQDAAETIDRPFTSNEIDGYLGVAADAARRLDDADLRAGIERLKNDPSPSVREAARRALTEGAPTAMTAGKPQS